MTGRRAWELVTQRRFPLDLDGMISVEELSLMAGCSGRTAAAVLAFVRADRALLGREPGELAAVLADQIPGVGRATGVRAAIWLKARPV